MKSWWWAIGAVAIVAVVVAYWTKRDSGPPEESVVLVPSRAQIPEAPRAVAARPTQPKAAREARAVREVDAAEELPEAEEPMTDEERAEAEEEKLVDAFDALTDKWQEPSEKGVTIDDVNAFVKQFGTVPKDRKEECLQRALNLIPDENVMLLLGVLMDKSQDKELVELVFNDILPRDEDVKQPILQQILKDKSHPCWKEAAWILDVQDEEK